MAVFPSRVALLAAAEQFGDLPLAEAEANAQNLDFILGHEPHMAGSGCFDQIVAFVGDQLFTGIRVSLHRYLDRDLVENAVAVVVWNVDKEVNDSMGSFHGGVTCDERPGSVCEPRESLQ